MPASLEYLVYASLYSKVATGIGTGIGIGSKREKGGNGISASLCIHRYLALFEAILDYIIGR